MYRTDTPGELIVQFRDDITAFDGGKKDVLTDKGATMPGSRPFFSGTWKKHGVQTHFIRMLIPSPCSSGHSR